jgi:hypothetical protein
MGVVIRDTIERNRVHRKRFVERIPSGLQDADQTMEEAERDRRRSLGGKKGL